MIYLLEQHYLLFACALAIAFAFWSKQNTWVWAILGFVMYLLWVNKSYFIVTDMKLYYIRAFIAFFTALIFVAFLTKFSIYQAFMQFLILAAYGVLEYDTEQGTNFLYDSYEVVMYGLVASQFIAIFPELGARCYNYYTSHFSNGSNSKGFSSL